MRIDEFADIIGINIEFIRFSNQNGRTICFFTNSDIKVGDSLLSLYGNGETAQNALNDYIDKIKGHCLVINASSPAKKEFNVPSRLTSYSV